MFDRKLRESFAPDTDTVDRVVTGALQSRPRSVSRLRPLAVGAATLGVLVLVLLIGRRENTPQTPWELVGHGEEIELRKNGDTVETTGPPGKILILTRPGGDV